MYPELGVGEASNLETPTQKQKYQQTPALLPKDQERVVQQDKSYGQELLHSCHTQ